MKSTLQITYAGQATALIQWGDQSFLTDPNFSETTLFLRRKEKLGIVPEALPPLAALLVSNAHYDHLDLFTYKYFKSTLPILVPKGLGAFVEKFLPHPVVEIPAWGFHQIRETKIHALPVAFHGFRILPFLHREACAYVLQRNDTAIYFAGNTGYGEHFKKAGELFNIEVAILPINSGNAIYPMKGQRMDAEQALQAARDLKVKHLIPLFWDAFPYLGEMPDKAQTELENQISSKKLPFQVHLLKVGEKLSVT